MNPCRCQRMAGPIDSGRHRQFSKKSLIPLTNLESRDSQMSTRALADSKPKRVPKTPEEWLVSELLRQYGCGPIHFAGSENAFYERHLVFDRVIDPRVASTRERFEAFSRSIRDVLAQRWVLTRST